MKKKYSTCGDHLKTFIVAVLTLAGRLVKMNIYTSENEYTYWHSLCNSSLGARRSYKLLRGGKKQKAQLGLEIPCIFLWMQGIKFCIPSALHHCPTAAYLFLYLQQAGKHSSEQHSCILEWAKFYGNRSKEM